MWYQSQVAFKGYIVNGWPVHRKLCRDQLKPFWKFKSELVEHNGLILRNNQVVIPAALRREVLNIIHIGHMGVVKCIEHAKNSVY